MDLNRISLDLTNTINSGVATGIQRVAREVSSRFFFDNENKYGFRVVNDIGLATPPDHQVSPLISAGILGLIRGLWVKYIQTASGSQIYRIPVFKKFIDLLARYLVLFKQAIINWRRPRFLEDSDYHLVLDAFWGSKSSIRVAKERKNKGSRVGFICFDVLPLEHPRFFEKELVKSFRRNYLRMLELADDIWCISYATKSALIEQFPTAVAGKNIRVFSLGSDISNRPSIRKKRHASRVTPKKIVMVGTIEPRKNHSQVLDWFDQLGKANYQLSIIGRLGWKSKDIEARIEDLISREPRISWFRNCDDLEMTKIISESDIGVVASFAEGFGLPIVELISAGLPVVASDIPVFREVGTNKPGLHFFTLGDLVSLNAAINDATDKFIESSEEFTPFTWNESTKALADLIRESLGNSNDSKTPH